MHRGQELKFFLAVLFLPENIELKGKEEKRWVINIKCFSFYHEWDWSASSIIDFSWLIFRLRDADVTPSHITSLDVTPSDVRTLDVLTSGHITFGKLHLRKLHLRAVSPSEYYTFGSSTSDGVTARKWSIPKVKHLEGVTSRRWNIQRCNCPKV